MDIRSVVVGVVLFAQVGAVSAEQRTSKSDPRLKRQLDRFPQADANGDGVLTLSEARAYRKKMGRQGTTRKSKGEPLPPPDRKDVHYGPHRLQTFDLWHASGDGTAPVALYIHGGGFRGGDKRSLSAGFLKQCLKGGISVAAINYRLTPAVKFPAPMHDCARAIQFLRHHAKAWRLDPTRIASTGGSAGAGISLWLAFHDDLADPKHADPVARQSTRLTCAAVRGAQSSYDPRFCTQIGLPRLMQHPALPSFYGLKADELDTPRAHKLYERASPINYVTRDDPPVLMDYGSNVPIDEKSSFSVVVHHPKFGFVLAEKMKALGVECIVQCRGETKGKAITQYEFIRKHFDRAAAKTR